MEKNITKIKVNYDNGLIFNLKKEKVYNARVEKTLALTSLHRNSLTISYY